MPQLTNSRKIALPASVGGWEGFSYSPMSLSGDIDIETLNYKGGLNLKKGAVETTGVILIRNSWGTHWGDYGYGWLPYDYVFKELAVDWWSLLENEWIDTGAFKI